MTRSARFRPPLRERIARNIASMRAQGIEPPAQLLAMARELQGPEPRKRLPRIDSPDKAPLEKDIQKAIMEAFAYHPRVVKCIRHNQGGAYYDNPRGGSGLVMFTSDLVTDLHIMLRDPPGWGWLEVKREGWRPHVGEFNPANKTLKREADQAAFLAAVREAGGIGAFVRSVDEALEAIA